MSVRVKKLSMLLNDLPIQSRFLNHSVSLDLDPLISEVTLDIAEVSAGVLFIARRLWYSDTHDQILEAIRLGATAVIVSKLDLNQEILESQIPIIWVESEDPTLGLICERFYESPTAKLKVYGVTGTNGKTSAVSYLAELLTAVGERVAVMGTVEYRFETKVLTAPNTTPDALVIQRFARQALDLGATALTLEVSSHALSLDRIAGVQFDAVGFTSFGRDHLDFHGSLEDYRMAKGRLFDDYLQHSIQAGKSPIAVAHADDDGMDMLGRVPSSVRKVRCVVNAWDHIKVSRPSLASTELDDYECELTLYTEAQPSLEGIELSGTVMQSSELCRLSPISAPLIGDYHPANGAIAFGMVAMTHPQAIDDAWQSLGQSRGVSGRMERVELPYLSSDDQRVALVDYAHTPDAITRALQAIRAVYQGHISVIIGCGGNRDRGKRPEMLRAAICEADEVWLTSDNPRDEAPSEIIQDALTGVDDSTEESYRVVVDRRVCIAQAWRSLPRQGALLITGKGHESYQEIKGRRYSLQDHEAVRAAAWAEVKGLTLTQVPFSASLSGQFGQDVDQKIQLFQLLREAGLRENGISIRILTQPIQSSETSLEVHYTSNIEQSLIASIYDQCEQLNPQHREIHLLTDLSQFEAVIEVMETLLSELIEWAYPRPQIALLKNDEPKPITLGGWSSLEAGPKIPSLT
jgi:UDP-N-acetylmuramoyl-L-alanyl-D-glutamate--2,6-diaminopimelate ligase